MRLKPRQEADIFGYLTYRGRPCVKAHSGLRYTETGKCVECERERLAARDAAKGVAVTMLRRQVLTSLKHWPMTSQEVAAELGRKGHSATAVDRAIRWASGEEFIARNGYLMRAERGPRPMLWAITDAGRQALAAMQGLELKEGRGRLACHIERRAAA